MISESKKRKMNPMLLNVLLISGGLHLIAILVLGGITVYNLVVPDEAQFEEPAEVAEEEPPPEIKIEIKKRNAPEEQSMQRLKMKQIANITVDPVDVDLPDMADSFTVSAGVGGFGTGSLLGNARGGLGMGMSNINIFGLKSSAERILFILDASPDMVVDAKGGLNSYKVIKDEITSMVGNLSAGTLFNVAVYDRLKIKFFKPQLIAAGEEAHQELESWLNPINSTARNLSIGSVPGTDMSRALSAMPDNRIQAAIVDGFRSRGNEIAFLTQIALEQNIDAAYIVTGVHPGFQPVNRPTTPEEEAEWAAVQASEEYKEIVAAFSAEEAEVKRKIRRQLAKINEERKAQGKPPKVLSTRGSTWHEARALGIEFKNPRPPRPPRPSIEVRDVESYFKDLIDKLYESKGAKEPSINVVLFLAGDEELNEEDDDGLSDYVRFFGGKYRVIRGLDEIRRAVTSAETENE
jgi:hypothetical protein